MTSVLKTSAIIAGILAVVPIAVYHYLKHRPTPISFEKILQKAVEEAKRINAENPELHEMDLIILNPEKTKQFFVQNKDSLKDFGLSFSQLSRRLIVVWLLQNGSDVVYQEAIVSNELAPDFADTVPEDKIYRKKIRISNDQR